MTINFEKLKLETIIVFSKELSLLLSSGIPLVKALELQTQETNVPLLKTILRNVVKNILKGNSFSSSLTEYEKYFGSLFINMINTAELSGKLPLILKSLAIHFSIILAIKRKINSIMIYPIFVLTTTVGLVLFIILFVFPEFLKLFGEKNIKLPYLTQILLNIYNYITNYYIINIIGIIFLIIFFIQFSKTETGKIFWINVIIHIPFLKGPYINYVLILILKNLSILLEAGVPITKAFSIMIELEKNILIKKDLKLAAEKIKAGVSISNSLRTCHFFTSISISMISIGEKSGSLPLMLESAIEFHQNKFNDQINSFTSLIEPLLIIFLGLLVGLIILAIYLPIFDVINVVS